MIVSRRTLSSRGRSACALEVFVMHRDEHDVQLLCCLLHRICRLMARSAASNRAEQCPLCPNTSDFDLLSDGKRIIDLDSEISDGTFHFLVAKQKLDRTQVAGATVDQGRLRAAERV